nr:RsiV family protein [Mycobacterium simulans]
MSTAAAVVVVATLSTPTSTSRADSGVSNGQTYAVTATSITGATPDDRGRWNAQVAQLSGGAAGVRDAFNKAGDASTREQIEQMRADASPDTDWLFESKSTVSFRAVAIAEVIVGVYSAKEAAHPTNYVSTVVIDSRSAKPVTLADLFSNEQDGLNRLAEQTKVIFPRVYGGGPTPMPDEPGNKPIAANFANWIPTSAGMEIHFADYQFGHGLPVITVPWPALTDVLAPDMMALTHD